MNYRTATFVCLAIVGVGFLLFIIGFSTSAWLRVKAGSTTIQSGLWKSCTKQGRVKSCANYRTKNLSHKHRATQAMECFALIAYIAAIVFTVLMVIKKKVALARQAAILASGLAALFIFIALMIFGINHKKHFDYSYVLTVLAGILSVVHAIVVFLLIKPDTILFPTT